MPLENEGIKLDAGKPRWDLLPAEAMEQLVAVYTFGSVKYGDRNWEKGMSWTRCFAALMRHSWAWMRGEDLDPESGLPHMAHAAFTCLALIQYRIKGVGTDDRRR